MPFRHLIYVVFNIGQCGPCAEGFFKPEASDEHICRKKTKQVFSNKYICINHLIQHTI